MEFNVGDNWRDNHQYCDYDFVDCHSNSFCHTSHMSQTMPSVISNTSLVTPYVVLSV